MFFDFLKNPCNEIYLPESKVNKFADKVPVWTEKIRGRKGYDIPDHLTIQAHDRGEAGVRRITRDWPYNKKLFVDAQTITDEADHTHEWHVFNWHWVDCA